MRAIGASSFGGGSDASRARAVWKVSIQVTSGDSRSTCRRFQAMPSAITTRMKLFRPGLLRKALIRTGDSSAATAPTATRNTTMRTR